MTTRMDIIIIGGGPAGVSAALTARNRNKNVLIITNEPIQSGLYKAGKIDNYPGLPGVSGPGLVKTLREHAQVAGVVYKTGRADAVSKTNNGFFVSSGSEVFESAAVILAIGVVQKGEYPGELELLGNGVSYCATCDGMLYRGKRVAVVASSPEAAEEAVFLAEIGCEVIFFAAGKNAALPAGDIPVIRAKSIEIKGGERVCAITADGSEYPCEGVFILRSALAPAALVPSLETADGHIKINNNMETSVQGVFAAGDCVGPPHQVAKAVGDGCVAGLSASGYASAF